MDFEQPVLCPGCSANGGLHYVHPTTVQVNRGGEITTVDHKGTCIARGAPVMRGANIVILFACEQGHTFRQEFQFHKGNTYFLEELDDAALAPGEPLEFGTLWRD